MRIVATFALRFLARAALSVWFGGFTFYAAVVVPDLHENLGGMETGEISRRVAVFLYAIGAASVALTWIEVATIRDQRSGWPGKLRLGLLALSTLLLIALILMHREMGARLDSGAGRGRFFSLHEAYLAVFAVQWAANLVLLALDSTARIASKGESRGSRGDRSRGRKLGTGSRP